MKPAYKQDFELDEPENGGSIEQQRALEQEIEKDELLNEINSAYGAETEIVHSAKILSYSTNNPHVANLIDPIPDVLKSGDLGGAENELSVATILNLIDKGISEAELEEILERAITSISSNMAKDKASAKKQMSQLLALVTVLERTMRQTQTNIELQKGLRNIQGKLGELVKTNNIDGMQQFLKSAELKTALKQSVNTALQQPDHLHNMASNVGKIAEANQQKLSQQTQQQKPDIQKLQVEAKGNAVSQMLNKLMDKGKDVLNISREQATKGSTLQSNQLAQQPMPKPVSLQQTVQNVNQNPNPNLNRVAANTIQLSQPMIKPVAQAQPAITACTQASEQVRRIETSANLNQPQQVKGDIQQQPKTEMKAADTKITETKIAQADKTSQITDKPPTSGHVHSGNCCGQNQANAAQNVPKEIKNAVNNGLSAEQRTNMLNMARESAGQDIKRAADVNRGLSQSAQMAF